MIEYDLSFRLQREMFDTNNISHQLLQNDILNFSKAINS